MPFFHGLNVKKEEKKEVISYLHLQSANVGVDL